MQKMRLTPHLALAASFDYPFIRNTNTLFSGQDNYVELNKVNTALRAGVEALIWGFFNYLKNLLI